MKMPPATLRPFQLSCLILTASAAALLAADQPQWGQPWTRNMVSDERGLPETFDLATGQNIAWIAPLGTQTHSTPIVAGGRVFIGTNNENPRDPKEIGDFGILLCLDEKDGHFLWQLTVPKRTEDQYFDWPKTGMASPVSVEGERAYFVDNRGEIVCLDVNGMANGNDGPFQDEGLHMLPRRARPPTFKPDPIEPGTPVPPPGPTDADIIWLFDMPAEAGTWPHDGAHSSILIHGDYLYVNTGNGVDNTHKGIQRPDAPSLIVLEKKTGRYVARDDEHIGPNIFHATWSSPSFAEVNGRPLIFFAGGDGIVRAFEPITHSPAAGAEPLKLKKVWWFDPDPKAPKEDIHSFLNNRQQGPSDIYAMPVFYDNRLFIAGGGDIFWGKNEAWLKCIDPTRTGDVTGTAEVWSAPLDRHVMSTPAIHDGLAFVADGARKIHCLDAETGREYWSQETRGEFWASPLVADGKLYIGTRKGDFWIMAASKEKKVLAMIDFKKPISATVTAANGTLFVATMNNLYAIRQGARAPAAP
jgi:outer membrane protein assembly factor BamB